MPYCLDTNTFIEAKNRYYGLDFCPAYWDWLDKEASTGQLLCVKPIFDEIVEGKDELAEWIKARKDDQWLCEVDAQEVQASYRVVVAYVESRRAHYTDAAIAKFMSGGDPWLIAYCLAKAHTLVTHERSEPNSKKKVKIPDICNALGVTWISGFEALRQLGAKFVLPKVA